MRDGNQASTIAAIERDLGSGGPYTGTHNYVDPHTVAAFERDMKGYLTQGTDPSGSNYADAYLGSYQERWWAIPSGGDTATAYFRVTNKTDLNSFFHPEILTGGAIISVDGAHSLFAPLDPWGFTPQYQTFQWQVTIQY